MERPDALDKPIVKKLIKLWSRLNVQVFRATGGLLGSTWRFGSMFPRGAPVALLTTIGRKSGLERTAPLIYGRDGDRLVFIASQGGLPKNPLWYRNLQQTPAVKVQTRRTQMAFTARTAEGDERDRLWALMCAIYPDYEQYQYWTERRIPVVVCDPL